MIRRTELSQDTYPEVLSLPSSWCQSDVERKVLEMCRGENKAITTCAHIGSGLSEVCSSANCNAGKSFRKPECNVDIIGSYYTSNEGVKSARQLFPPRTASAPQGYLLQVGDVVEDLVAPTAIAQLGSSAALEVSGVTERGPLC